MLILLAAAVLSSPGITYSTPGKRAGLVLKDLTVLSGVTLEARHSTENEVLAIDVHDVALETLEQKIAVAVDGSWTREGAIWYLGREASIERQEEAKRRKRQLETLRSEIKKRFSPNTQEPFDAAAAVRLSEAIEKLNKDDNRSDEDVNALSNRTPLGRAAVALLNAFDLDSVLDQQDGIPYVYSSQPTASQRPMPVDAAQLVRDYTSATMLWGQVMADHLGFQPDEGPQTSFQQIRAIMNRSLSDPAQPTVTLLLRVTKVTAPLQVDFDLMAYAPDGSKLEDDSNSLGQSPDDPPQTKTATDSEPALHIPIGCAALFRPSSIDTQIARTATEALRKSLLDPETEDPISLVSGPMFLEAARDRGRNLVADLPDAVFSQRWRFQAPTVGLSEFLSRLSNEVSMQEADSWLVFSPVDPLYARSVQTDRKVLRSFSRLAHDEEELSLEEKAAYSLQLPLNIENRLPTLVYGCVTKGLDTLIGNDDELYRFYGMLSDDQRAAARAGRLTYGMLSTDQRVQADRWVYREDDADWTGDTQRPADIYLAETEAAPNGIDPSQRIELIDTVEPCVFEARNGRPVRLGLGANLFAQNLYLTEHPEGGPDANFKGPAPSSATYFYGVHRTVSIGIHLQSEIVVAGRLQQFSHSHDGPTSFDQLPEEFRTRVLKILAEDAKTGIDRDVGVGDK